MSLIVLCLASLSLSAAEKKVFLQLRSGTSVPLLEYAAPRLDDGCFTTTGFSASVAASIDFTNHWGLIALAGFNLHNVDVGYLGYEKVQADPFLLDVTIRSEPYRILTFLAGPTYNTALSHRFNLQAAAMAGYFGSRTPHQIYKPVYFLTGPEFFEITSTLDRSFAWGVSTTVSYEITPFYELGLTTDFMRSAAAFRFQTPDGNLRTDHRKISMLNISLNLMLRLPYPKVFKTQ